MSNDKLVTGMWKPPANNPVNRDVAILEAAWAKACVAARRRFLRDLSEMGAREFPRAKKGGEK